MTAGGTFAGQTTTTAADDYSVSGSGCPGGGLGSGNDVVYSVQPSSTTRYRVTVVPEGNFDPMLYAVSACDFSNGCLAGTVLSGPGFAESIEVDAPGGVLTYIIVDGELLSNGGFELSVELL